MSTVPNLEVRGKCLFQELALTEVYSELRRHSNKLLNGGGGQAAQV